MGESSVNPRGSGFSVVVAMDRKRGIGKDGGLPWPKLKGDMKFFRELTTCPDRAAVEKRWALKPEESAETKTWDDVSAMLKFAHKLPEASNGNQNAVLMGRKTWESLPESFRPLPERHNRVMTRNSLYAVFEDSSSLEESPVSYTEELLTGGFRSGLIEEGIPGFPSFPPLPPLPYSQIFVIGGGQIFAHSLRYITCAHLYITEIDAEFPCDTYFPETPGFKPVLSSPWIVEGGIRYRFRRYDRVS